MRETGDREVESRSGVAGGVETARRQWVKDKGQDGRAAKDAAENISAAGEVTSNREVAE